MKALKTLIDECRSGATDYQELVDRFLTPVFWGSRWSRRAMN